MSSKKQITAAKTVADNITENKEANKASNSDVMLAVHLPLSHVFDDIPDGSGGVKSVLLPGVNTPGGILLGVGKAKAVTLSSNDWGWIKKLHGNERMFNSFNGAPPCVMEIKDPSALKGDEVKAMRHGVEPITPGAVSVTDPAK